MIGDPGGERAFCFLGSTSFSNGSEVLTKLPCWKLTLTAWLVHAKFSQDHDLPEKKKKILLMPLCWKAPLRLSSPARQGCPLCLHIRYKNHKIKCFPFLILNFVKCLGIFCHKDRSISWALKLLTWNVWLPCSPLVSPQSSLLTHWPYRQAAVSCPGLWVCDCQSTVF